MRQLLRLRRFLDLPPERKRSAARCELCGIEIRTGHSHVLDTQSRSLMCACRPCYLLFTSSGAAGGRYQSMGERYVRLPELVAGSDIWEQSGIPVGVAFFLLSSSSNRALACYPSPAGATESGLPLNIWSEIVSSHSTLRTLEPDVEALLVYRRPERSECWIVPVDACYELVGRIRRYWRGFDGGEDAKREIEAFFAALRQHEMKSAPC